MASGMEGGPPCCLSGLYREWVNQDLVRKSAVQSGRLIQPAPGRASVRGQIKDCVRNKDVLVPLLDRMAAANNKLFYLQTAVSENLACSLKVKTFSWRCA